MLPKTQKSDKKLILSILNELDRDYSDRGIKQLKQPAVGSLILIRPIATLLLVCGQKNIKIFQGFQRRLQS